MADIENVLIGQQQMRGAASDIKVEEAAIEAGNEKEDASSKEQGSVVYHHGHALPTEEELHSLRRVADRIPWSIYTIAFVELCERFSYYGTIAVFTNFIQWPMPKGSTTGSSGGSGQPGAMGFGQRASTGLTTFNSFWGYTMPLFGAWIADSRLGRYKTIAWALAIDIFGHAVLFTSAMPPVLRKPEASMGAFIIGIIAMGIGTGGFKPNVNPLIIEQLPADRMRVETLPTGERVIVDPAVTASRVYNYFYLFINLGAIFGQLGMVYAEYYVGFWLSFLLPTILLSFCPAVMWWGRKRYHREPPSGSVLGKAMKLFFMANRTRWSVNPVTTYKRLHDGTFWENVKPSRFPPGLRPPWMTFDDNWVEEVRRGFHACAVFLWYPLFWICYNQMTNNLISQAAVMQLNGIPNDILTNLNPLTLVFLIPAIDLLFYPFLRKMRIRFTPIKRIATGYFVAACAMVWSAVVQYYIYKKSPCGYYASGDLPDGERCPPAPITVWAQSGSYVLIGLSEVFTLITSLEYAYSKAPSNMRSMVQSIALFMNAIASAIGFALVSLSAVSHDFSAYLAPLPFPTDKSSQDPLLVWNYSVVAILAAIGGACFYLQFRGLDKKEDELNNLPKGKFAAGTSTEAG